MPTSVGAYEAKTKPLELLERAAAGQEIITKHDRPIAKLVPVSRPSCPDLEALFRQMDEIRSGSPPNPPGKEALTLRELIDEGRP